MFETVAQLKCPYILSHIQGTPQTMQLNPQYEDVVLDVVKELSLKVKQLEDAGVHDIIIDPGFGFGKTIEQNYELLAGLPLLNRAFKYPILLGLSRKSMLYKPLGLTPQESLNATTAAHMIALQNGAQLLRVHDVKEAKQAIQLWELSQAGL
jgi:dihydropteroate synthase